MYQYTTNNVINSLYALDYNGNRLVDGNGSDIYKFVGTAAGLNVTKVGYFKTANIVSIYKRPYSASVKEVAEITIPTIASGLTARLDIVLRLSNATQAEYANYSLDFLKPITVEVVATNSASADATALVAQLNLLKDRFGKEYFKAVVDSSTKVRITCKEDVQRVKSMVISKSATSYSSTIQPLYTDVSSTTFTIVTAGQIGFGNDLWMNRQFMLPTAENVRTFGISKDERPIPGGNYSEYVLRYSVTKDIDGISLQGTSITTHVFWVLSTLVDDFEANIYGTGKQIISVSTDQTFTLSLQYDNTASVKVLISAIVPFISATSEITATSSATGKATIGAKVVNAPTGDPYVQTATVALTKVDVGATTITITIDGVSKTVDATIGVLTADATGNHILSTGVDATDQIVYAGNAGAVTFSTTATTMIAINATGLVTTAGKTATGTAAVVVTDAFGNTATVTYTIAA